jgi:hypothetical protein
MSAPAPAPDALRERYVQAMCERLIGEVVRLQGYPMLPEGDWWRLEVRSEDEQLLLQVRARLDYSVKRWIKQWRLLDGSPEGRILL